MQWDAEDIEELKLDAQEIAERNGCEVDFDARKFYIKRDGREIILAKW